MARRTTKPYRADVKPHKRRPFGDAGFVAHGRTVADAREHFARIFDVPVRWVRVRREA